MANIGTVKDNEKYRERYTAHILRSNEVCPEFIGSFTEWEKAVEAIKQKDPNIVLVSPYRFDKEATAF